MDTISNSSNDCVSDLKIGGVSYTFSDTGLGSYLSSDDNKCCTCKNYEKKEEPKKLPVDHNKSLKIGTLVRVNTIGKIMGNVWSWIHQDDLRKLNNKLAVIEDYRPNGLAIVYFFDYNFRIDVSTKFLKLATKEERERYKAYRSLYIKKVIINDKATVVLFDNGDKEVVKCEKGDLYDPRIGVLLCIAKHELYRSGYDGLLTLMDLAAKDIKYNDLEKALGFRI